MVSASLSASLAFLLLFGAPQGATADTREALQALRGHGPSATQTALEELKFDHFRLANGMEVILVEDRSAPLVAVDVWYHVGSGDEQPGKSGFAHLFEHMMFQGAKHIGEDVHFDTLKRIGGTGINGTTNSDRTNYFEVVPSNHLETALWLESDRMGYLLDLLNEKSLANQRDVVRNERRQRYDNVAYAPDRFATAAALYPEGHPYRYLTIGRHEDLEGAALEDVRAFFKRWYAPSNATLTVVGDFDVKAARGLVEKWFGSFPKIERPQQAGAGSQVASLSKPVRVEVEDKFARMPRLHWAWHAPKSRAPGADELELLGSTLSAEGWGRLHKRLVLEEKLARSAFAYYQDGNISGSFHVVIDLVTGADASRVEAIVKEEIDNAIAKPVDAEALARVVRNEERGLVMSLESLLGRAEALQRFGHYAGDPAAIRSEIPRLRAITPAAVREAAATHLSKPSALIVTKPVAAPVAPAQPKEK